MRQVVSAKLRELLPKLLRELRLDFGDLILNK